MSTATATKKKDSGIVTIHGKEYETVALRVQKFRDLYPKYALVTKLVERNENDVVMKATIRNEEGRVISTGYAEEKRSASMINKTSALENCETSAIGRCLAAFGMGGTEYATADEVANAIKNQNSTPKPYEPSKTLPASDRQRAFIANLLRSSGVPNEEMGAYLNEHFGIQNGEMSQADASQIIEDLNQGDTNE